MDKTALSSHLDAIDTLAENKARFADFPTMIKQQTAAARRAAGITPRELDVAEKAGIVGGLEAEVAKQEAPPKAKPAPSTRATAKLADPEG